MDRRPVRSWLASCLTLSGLLISRFALGAPNDAAAQRLRDQAINQDYLATDFASAEKKLTDALSLCQKTSDCSASIRARVHCDLGVVDYMLHKVDLARTEFATALLEDPQVDLDKDLSNTDVRNEFAAVKSGGPPPVASGPASAPAGQSPGDEPAGPMKHTPPARQLAMTPLPLYVEVPPELGASKVVVRYKAVGGVEWKTAPLGKVGNGYGGEIPCGDVGRKEGDLQYFIQALDASGDLVAASGRSASPQVVPIVKSLDGEAPHLPGQPPPQTCKTVEESTPPSAPSVEAAAPGTPDTGDCPPDFPGCHSEPTACESNDDCMSGDTCEDKTCRKAAKESGPFKKNWVSLGVQADLLFMPSAVDACLGASPANGYTCFQSKTYYAATPVRGVDDQVIGGLASAPMLRILAGYDRVVLSNVTIGARLGYTVLGGGPQRPAHGSSSAGAAFLPVHAEARIAYYFGKNVFNKKGVRFYLFASGGMTEVDASQSIAVQPPTGKPVFVDAWTKTGLGFVAGGPGLMIALTRNGGIFVEAKPIFLFPTSGVAIGAQVGYAIGL